MILSTRQLLEQKLTEDDLELCDAAFLQQEAKQNPRDETQRQFVR